MKKSPTEDPQKIPQALEMFTDRVEERKLAQSLLSPFNESDSVDGKKYLTTFYGVGGVGKTTLCEHAITQVNPLYKDKVVVVRLNLDNKSWNVKSPFAHLVAELVRESGKQVPLPMTQTLLLLYAQVDKGACVQSGESGIWSAVNATLGAGADVIGIPFFNLLVDGALWLKDKRRQKDVEKSLRDKDLWPDAAGERIDVSWLAGKIAVALFEDIKAWAKHSGKSLRLLLDGFERIQSKDPCPGDCQSLLQDFAGYIATSDDPTLKARVRLIFFGRERLCWEDVDKEWSAYSTQHILGGLSEKDARDFLSKYSKWLGENQLNVEAEGIEKYEKWILDAADERINGLRIFYPYYLDLAVVMVRDAARKNQEPDLGKTPAQLQERFLRYLPKNEQDLFKILALAATFDSELFNALVNSNKIVGFPVDNFGMVVEGRSYVILDTNGLGRCHRLMEKSLQDKWLEDRKNRAYGCKIIRWLLNEHYQSRLIGDYLEIWRRAMDLIVSQGVEADLLPAKDCKDLLNLWWLKAPPSIGLKNEMRGRILSGIKKRLEKPEALTDEDARDYMLMIVHLEDAVATKGIAEFVSFIKAVPFSAGDIDEWLKALTDKNTPPAFAFTGHVGILWKLALESGVESELIDKALKSLASLERKDWSDWLDNRIMIWVCNKIDPRGERKTAETFNTAGSGRWERAEKSQQEFYERTGPCEPQDDFHIRTYAEYFDSLNDTWKAPFWFEVKRGDHIREIFRAVVGVGNRLAGSDCARLYESAANEARACLEAIEENIPAWVTAHCILALTNQEGAAAKLDDELRRMASWRLRYHDKRKLEELALHLYQNGKKDEAMKIVVVISDRTYQTAALLLLAEKDEKGALCAMIFHTLEESGRRASVRTAPQIKLKAQNDASQVFPDEDAVKESPWKESCRRRLAKAYLAGTDIPVEDEDFARAVFLALQAIETDENQHEDWDWLTFLEFLEHCEMEDFIIEALDWHVTRLNRFPRHFTASSVFLDTASSVNTPRILRKMIDQALSLSGRIEGGMLGRFGSRDLASMCLNLLRYFKRLVLKQQGLTYYSQNGESPLASDIFRFIELTEVLRKQINSLDGRWVTGRVIEAFPDGIPPHLEIEELQALIIDPFEQAEAWLCRASASIRKGDAEECLRFLKEAYAASRQVSDPHYAGILDRKWQRSFSELGRSTAVSITQLAEFMDGKVYYQRCFADGYLEREGLDAQALREMLSWMPLDAECGKLWLEKQALINDGSGALVSQ